MKCLDFTDDFIAVIEDKSQHEKVWELDDETVCWLFHCRCGNVLTVTAGEVKRHTHTISGVYTLINLSIQCKTFGRKRSYHSKFDDLWQIEQDAVEQPEKPSGYLTLTAYLSMAALIYTLARSNPLAAAMLLVATIAFYFFRQYYP